MKLLVLIHPKFNDIELTTTIYCLKASGLIDQVTYYNPTHIQAWGQQEIVKINLENHFEFKNYDALFIPGGRGAIELREDERSLAVIDKFMIDKKWIFAICDAPNVLFENDYLQETSYSSYPIENIKNKSGKLRNSNMVTIDGKIITAKCPASALEFGLAIVNELAGKEIHDNLKSALFALGEQNN